ncbi:hypothetical protein [Ktedonospora formicarum]|uniref:Uncharacterized protein n=1 Tax=Ktedonospora formicarum TaxID=2778364 RepID=A0A8J3HZZ8_9CHLR|nr:hypothetical protein [Ktedonospora formicarum]GHO44265.1 hypothetical protein KSX_24280 [Ktedonospora formicarum]
MQEANEVAFTLDGTLAANPHLHDYFHYLTFSQSGDIQMGDGAGQFVIAIVKGKFSIKPLDQRTLQLYLYDLVELDPHKPVRALEPYIVKVTREEGLFAFRQIWWEYKNEDQEQWPCILYWARYVFEPDPLKLLSSNREKSLYHRIMVEPDTRYYYSQDDRDADTLTLADLRSLGVSPQTDAYIRDVYKHSFAHNDVQQT